MSSIAMSSFLRRVLLADAVVSAGAGLVMLLGADLLPAWLGLPTALLAAAGALLLPYAALLLWLARRPQVPRTAIWFAVVCNVMWAADCLFVAAGGSLGGSFAPTPLGQAFIGVQVLSVLVFAELQFMALRRERRVAMA